MELQPIKRKKRSADAEVRRLNEPREIPVRDTDDGLEPVAVQHGGAWVEVAEIQDCWKVDDEWWRERPVGRTYFAVLLESDVRLTVFHDTVGGGWFRQEY